MQDTKRTAILKSALWFALVGPLVGYVPLITIGMAVLNVNGLYELIPIIIAYVITVGLLGAYIVGAPAAFVVGAAQRVLRDRGISGPWIVIINVVLGATLSALTIYVLDVYVLPRPHGDSLLLGQGWWLVVALTGGFAAMICTIVSLAKCRPIRGPNAG